VFWRAISRQFALKATKQVRKTRLQTFGHFFDVHERDIPHAALDSAVVSPVEPAALRRLFLIDPLSLAYAANSATEPDPDIDGHHLE
jgi:hypothetical protein